MRLLMFFVSLVALAACTIQTPASGPAPATGGIVSAPTVGAPPLNDTGYYASLERSEPFEAVFESLMPKVSGAIKAQQIGAVGAYRQLRLDADDRIVPSCPETPEPSTFAFGDGYDGPVLFCSQAKSITVQALGWVKGNKIDWVAEMTLGTSSLGAVALAPGPMSSSFTATLHLVDGGTLQATPEMTAAQIKEIDQRIIDTLKKIQAEFGW